MYSYISNYYSHEEYGLLLAPSKLSKCSPAVFCITFLGIPCVCGNKTEKFELKVLDFMFLELAFAE